MRFKPIRLAVFASFVFIISNFANAASTPLNIAVSILPEKYFVEQVGKSHIHVTVVVPPGAEPATYAPTVGQMRALSKSTIYFTMGVPFERAWLPRFTGANPDIKIVPIYNRVCRRAWPAAIEKREKSQQKNPTSESTANHCHPINPDPHTWMSPPLVRIMAGSIRDALIKADPVHEQDYRRNYHQFVKEIDTVDLKIINALTGKTSGKSFMVYHPAFGYFARAYGLHQLPVENMGTEPTAKQLSDIVMLAKRRDIKVVFVQPQFSRRAAQSIANEIDGQVISVDPLAENWSKNLVSIAKAFSNALKN